MNDGQITLFAAHNDGFVKTGARLERTKRDHSRIRTEHRNRSRLTRYDYGARRNRLLADIGRLLSKLDKKSPNETGFPVVESRRAPAGHAGTLGSRRHQQIEFFLSEGVRTIFSALFPGDEDLCGFQVPGNCMLDWWLAGLPEWGNVKLEGRNAKLNRKYPDLAFTYDWDVVLIEIGEVDVEKWPHSWWIHVNWDGAIISRNHKQMYPYWGNWVDWIPVWVEGAMQPLTGDLEDLWRLIDYGAASLIEMSECPDFLLETLFPARDIKVLEQRLSTIDLVYLYNFCFALTWLDAVFRQKS